MSRNESLGVILHMSYRGNIIGPIGLLTITFVCVSQSITKKDLGIFISQEDDFRMAEIKEGLKGPSGAYPVKRN